MSQDLTQKIYTINGVAYRLEPPSWQQNKWLAEHIFKTIDLELLDFATIWDLFREKGPLIMAISLLPDGVTRADHSRQPWATIYARSEEFAAELTGAEVAVFAPHFFQFCQREHLAMLIPGKTLVKQFDQTPSAGGVPSRAPGEAGSSTLLSPSAAGMSPSSAPSSQNGGHTTQTPISGDALSANSLTGPSSVGSELNSHG
ncbi:MAG: hypothetical protein OEY77_00215 [Nitrospira sp.]|nr:hypothetical protein [Nitrospira sp.]